MLQLLVNPAMRPTLRLITTAVDWVNNNQPAKLFRVCIWLFPTLSVLVHYFGLGIKWVLRRDFFGSQDRYTFS